ncbi:BNR-4 repeat-containing protein [Spirosoma sp. BT702]|uniref:BNR-4 repeat-containing protein n=1 Tax=Spirosoma profusum TaxID=2771354 RepID=A0A927AQX4_9BACT|nr:BNR-4 repeat-containing protein [Spirosoma profusum]MBD2701398.1 BNR-4 repeat-containing protein [Spirosoma profusum]
MIIRLFAIFLISTSTVRAQIQTLNQPDDGFRGIWYFIGPTKTEYAFKYSGGLGTYPANHHPFAVYAPAVQKTFFCYGGASKDAKPSLLHEIAYFDHRTGQVSRPTILLDKGTDDAHDNPVLNIDRQGYIWLFSTSHGTDRPSFIHKSRKPYDISAFDRIPATRMQGNNTVPFDNFSYLQSHYHPEKGFLHLMTHYERGMLKYGATKPRRTIGYISSRDGVHWSALQDIAAIEEGHYQTSHQQGKKVGTAFNMHPDTEIGAGLDYRTNLYYVETSDFGQSWHTADGQPVQLPLRASKNNALVKEYRSLGRNVYINDVAHDAHGHPAILYITSKGPEPGPESGPYEWHIAHWTGKTWDILDVTTSDHNYDMGSLYIESDGTWRIIGPTGTGPQAYNTGGELSVWISRDKGKHWQHTSSLTRNSPRNHSYPRRPVRAHEGFYAFWADGNGREPSPSSFYFSTKAGEVYRLPGQTNGMMAKPERVKVDK